MTTEAHATESDDTAADDTGTDLGYETETYDGTDDVISTETGSSTDHLIDELLAEGQGLERPPNRGIDDPEEPTTNSEETIEASDGETADTEETAEPTEPKVPGPASQVRIVRENQRLEAENVELRRLYNEARQVPQQGAFRPSGDLMTDMMELAGHYGNFKPDDRDRMTQALQRFGTDLVAELAGDTNDPTLQARRQARQQATNNLQIQRQIDELKRGNADKDRQIAEQDARGKIDVVLGEIKAADEYPYLYAAEDDVSGRINEALNVLYAQGWRATDRQSVLDTVSFVSKRLDDEHRKTVERLEAVRSKKAVAPAQKAAATPISQQHQTDRTRGTLKDGSKNRGEDRGRKTVTASNVGSRTAPAPRTDLTPDELFEETLREQREERKARSASARRNG